MELFASRNVFVIFCLIFTNTRMWVGIVGEPCPLQIIFSGVHFIWKKFRENLHLVEFLWTLIEKLLHVFKLSICFVSTLEETNAQQKNMEKCFNQSSEKFQQMKVSF